MASTVASANWYPDPTGRYRLRYWDGSAWTHHVATDDGQALDPVGDTALPLPPPVDLTQPPASKPAAASALASTTASGPPPVEAFGPPPGPGAPPPPPPRRPSARLLLAAGAGVVVVAAIVIAVLALRGGGGSSTTNSSGTAAPAERPFRLPERIGEFALRPETSNAVPSLSVIGTYNRTSPPAGFVLGVIRMTDTAAAGTAIQKGIADLKQRWNSSTAESVSNAGTSYTCVTGAAASGSGSPAVGCYWRVGDAVLSIDGISLDQQTLLNLALQAQSLVIPAG